MTIHTEIRTKLRVLEIDHFCLFDFEVDGKDISILKAMFNPKKDIFCSMFSKEYGWMFEGTYLEDQLIEDAKDHLIMLKADKTSEYVDNNLDSIFEQTNQLVEDFNNLRALS